MRIVCILFISALLTGCTLFDDVRRTADNTDYIKQNTKSLAEQLLTDPTIKAEWKAALEKLAQQHANASPAFSFDWLSSILGTLSSGSGIWAILFALLLAGLKWYQQYKATQTARAAIDNCEIAKTHVNEVEEQANIPNDVRRSRKKLMDIEMRQTADGYNARSAIKKELQRRAQAKRTPT